MSKKNHVIVVGAKGVGKTHSVNVGVRNSDDAVRFKQPFVYNQLNFFNSSKFRRDDKVFSQMVAKNIFNSWDAYAESSLIIFVQLKNKRRLFFDEDGRIGFV